MEPRLEAEHVRVQQNIEITTGVEELVSASDPSAAYERAGTVHRHSGTLDLKHECGDTEFLGIGLGRMLGRQHSLVRGVKIAGLHEGRDRGGTEEIGRQIWVGWGIGITFLGVKGELPPCGGVREREKRRIERKGCSSVLRLQIGGGLRAWPQLGVSEGGDSGPEPQEINDTFASSPAAASPSVSASAPTAGTGNTNGTAAPKRKRPAADGACHKLSGVARDYRVQRVGGATRVPLVHRIVVSTYCCRGVSPCTFPDTTHGFAVLSLTGVSVLTGIFCSRNLFLEQKCSRLGRSPWLIFKVPRCYLGASSRGGTESRDVIKYLRPGKELIDPPLRYSPFEDSLPQGVPMMKMSDTDYRESALPSPKGNSKNQYSLRGNNPWREELELPDVFDNIEKKGASCNFGTKTSESMYGAIRETYHRLTNFNDVTPQATPHQVEPLQLAKHDHRRTVATFIRDQMDAVNEDPEESPEDCTSGKPEVSPKITRDQERHRRRHSKGSSIEKEIERTRSRVCPLSIGITYRTTETQHIAPPIGNFVRELSLHPKRSADLFVQVCSVGYSGAPIQLWPHTPPYILTLMEMRKN
ncbi:hypothetical protein B0H14DRAFT_2594822 [Mycena olivaceomarginata]|nr:hypothetical protein B0H14DRAFT_2594822 [Mycena olivaceomarginata]